MNISQKKRGGGGDRESFKVLKTERLGYQGLENRKYYLRLFIQNDQSSTDLSNVNWASAIFQELG